MKIEEIQLIEEEQKLFDWIFPLDFRSEDVKDKLLGCQKLALLILNRKAVPEHRIKYFTDPEYQLGRSNKSRHQIFEDNGRLGNDIFKDPSFVKYLRYFIKGANLPDVVRHGCEVIVSGHEFYPGDSLDELKAYFRKTYGKRGTLTTTPNDLDEKVFRLALDLRLPFFEAKLLRDYVKRL